MQRYRQYGQMDDVPEITGDGGFGALDMLTDPALLPQGTLSLSENMRFDLNGTTVRAGMTRQFPAGQNISLTIYGVGVFKPADDVDYLIFVTASYLVLFNLATQVFTAVNYPSGQTISADDPVDVWQAGVGTGTLPTVYILHGVGNPVLKYDDNTGLVTVASNFEAGDFALFYQDRFAVAQTQTVNVSDFLDFTTWEALNQFQILKGGSDYLQCFLTYQKDYVLIGTRQAWYVAYFDPSVADGGYTGPLNDSSTLQQLTAEAGCVGNKAALESMGLIWFISDAAIYAFKPQLDNELTVLGKPISAPIQPIMNRMCLSFAQGSAVERYGYRLYFAMPISDETVSVVAVTVTTQTTDSLVLPFTLPASISTNAVALVNTLTPHGLNAGDTVLLAGATDAALNGQFIVTAVVDSYNYQVDLNINTSATAGGRMTSQRMATRNNCIAVYNLNLNAWESIDWMPAGLFADFLRVAEIGAQRRLVVIDQNAGPLLYENGEADDVGGVIGGITLPFTLPVQMSAANYAQAPIAGHIITRSLRWQVTYTNIFAPAFSRKITACEVRATFDADSAVTMNLMVRTPNNTTWTGTRNFVASQFPGTDCALRKRSGVRGLEAQVELIVTGGRPTFRSVVTETVNAGRTEE